MSYFKDMKTNKVFTGKCDGQVMAKVKAGDITIITQEEFEKAQDQETNFSSIGAHFRVIHSRVPEETFYAFVKRCKEEHVSINEGLALLIDQYAHGARLTHISKKALDRFDYRSEHSILGIAEVTTKE